MQTLEHLVAEVIELHPEYHDLLDSGAEVVDQEFGPEIGPSNPFLHMGMHISLGEQLAAERPAGIRHIYQQLMQQNPGDRHETEHQMMGCLELSLMQAQQQQRMPDEQEYLKCLQGLLRNR